MPRLRDELFKFGGLADFLHFLDWACGLANTRERLARMAYDFCRRLRDDGTGYADVIVNPTHWSAWRGRMQAMIEALDEGFTSAERDGLPSVGLCISLLRTQTADEAIELSSNSNPGGCRAWSRSRLTATRPPLGGPALASPRLFERRARRG